MIKRLPEEAYEHFMPDGKLIGRLTKREHLELRRQIREKRFKGVTVKKNNEIYTISDAGLLSTFMSLYTQESDAATALFAVPTRYAEATEWQPSLFQTPYIMPTPKPPPKIWYEQPDGSRSLSKVITSE